MRYGWRHQMKKVHGFFYVFVGLMACSCGGSSGKALDPDANIISSSISLTNGTGTAVGVIPATGTPAGVVTGRIRLNPGLDVDFTSARMSVVRDDSVALSGSPATMDYNAFNGEFSAALGVPANTSASARTYTVSITAKDSAGAPVPFVSRIGTFTQAAP